VRLAARAAAAAALAMLVTVSASPAAAQGSAGRMPARGVRLPVPSRADSLLAQGRLAAAEDALYAAVDARPRDPAARGALAAYLASRGRFTIALVLLDEAQRFGADAERVRLARRAILPYTSAAPAGAETTVPLTRGPAGTLGAVPIRSVRAAPATQLAIIDPNRIGVAMGLLAASRFEVRAGEPLRELWVGDRRLLRLSVSVDSSLAPDELRLGLDVIWSHEPLFDERAGTLTLGRRAPAGAQGAQIPWLLTFPGLQLVPEVGAPPLRIESAAGRALLQGTRWQVDPRQATIRVAR
jgi:hypothetical protein